MQGSDLVSGSHLQRIAPEVSPRLLLRQSTGGLAERLALAMRNPETRLRSDERVGSPVSLRKRIEKSPLFSGLFGTLVTRYLALCDRTTRWQYEGYEELQAALAEGPVLVLMWHSRMVMGARHWPSALAPASSLHHRSPLGRISGVMQRQEGMTPFEMSHRKSNLVASRQVLKRFREGITIVMTGDGPVGPARQLQAAPLDWASRLNAPIFAYAFSTTRGHRFNTWDRLLLPYPMCRGSVVFARYDRVMPEARDAQKRSLEAFIDETTARADMLVRQPPTQNEA